MSDDRVRIGKAPYNFIPLPEKILARYESVHDLPTHDASRNEDRNLLSGEITFNIVAKQPIIVAEAGEQANEKHFFKNKDDKYEIPGSSLRGALRNAVSILSLSDWTGKIDDKYFFYRTIAGNNAKLRKYYQQTLDIKTYRQHGKTESVPERVQAGYIVKEKDHYYIYEAKTDNGRHGKTFYKVSSQSVTGNKNEFIRKVRKGFLSENVTYSVNERGHVERLFDKNASFHGQILYSGFIRRGRDEKNSAYVINEIDLEKSPKEVPLEDIQAYKADLEFRKSKFPHDHRKRMTEYFSLPDQNGTEYAKPCFYLEYNGKIYFGFTPFLRLQYPFSTKQLLSSDIKDKQPGIDYEKALFGFTQLKENENEVFNYASRIHVHAAEVKNDVSPLPGRKVTLRSPSATAYSIYLNQENVETTKQLKTYLDKEATIRGAKQYWVKRELDDENGTETIYALPKGTTFQAKITFDQLHEDELGLLLFALSKPEHYQLGMAKPYGYGVVTFEQITCHVTNNEKMYQNIKEMFNIGNEQVSIERYVQTYLDYVNEHFSISDLEALPSVNAFLTMKQASPLEKEEMTYMSLREYNDNPRLPTVEELTEKGVKSNVTSYVNSKQRGNRRRGFVKKRKYHRNRRRHF